jgi:hypothetical protein
MEGRRTTRWSAGTTVAAVLCALITSGCGPPGDQASELPTWTVAATPITEIRDDDASGTPTLAAVVGVTRLPDGRVLVADRALFALRWFDPDGSLQRSLGRQGKGPGEWSYIARMLRCGDRVLVFDIERGTGVHIGVTLDGELTGSTTISGPALAPPYNSACNASGLSISLGWERFDDLRQITRQTKRRWDVAYWLSDTTGAVATSLGERPGSERFVSPNGSRPYPLGRQPVIGIGSRFAYIGSADSAIVNRIALDGSAAGTLQLPASDLATTPNDIARYQFNDTVGQSAEEVRYRVSRWADIEWPITIPAYDALLLDHADRVFVRRPPRAIGAAAEWIVFDTEGRPLARLELPGTFEVHEFGPGYAAGVFVDPVSGEQTVRVLRIVE